MDDAAPPSRRGALLPNLVAAFGIFAYLVVLTVIVSAIDQLGRQAPDFLDFVLKNGARVAVLHLAFAAACLLSFWLVAPIVARLSLGTLIVRVLIAAGIAFVVLVPIEFVQFTAMFAGNQPADGAGIYDVTYPYLEATEVFFLAMQDAFQTAIGRVPLIALAGLALWLWLRRTVPGEAPDGGPRTGRTGV
jgi:hypothetical protein